MSPSDPAALRALCGRLQRCEVLGLDVETAHDFGTLCLLQVAIQNHTYLIDPFPVADLSPSCPHSTENNL